MAQRRPAPPRVHPQPHAALRLFGGRPAAECWGYLLQVFGTPMPVFAGKILHRALTMITDDLASALVALWVLLMAVILPLVVEIFVDRWYYGTNAFDK